MTLLGTYYTYYVESGTNTPTSLDERFFFNVYLDNQSGNSSNIHIDSYMYCNHPAGSQVTGLTSYAYVTVNNYTNITSTTNTIPAYSNSTHYLGTVYRTIDHNADGTGSFSFYGGGKYWSGQAEPEYTATQYISLPTIPRYANITNAYLRWVTISKASFYISTDVTCNYCRYYMNGSSSWTDVTGSEDTFYAFDVSNLGPASSGYIQIEVRRKDSGLWTKSGNIWYATQDYARITNCVDFNDEQNPVIAFTNPSGAQITFRFEALNTTIQRDNIANTSPYTMVLTENERNAFRSNTPNSNTMSVRYVIATKEDGVEKYWSFFDRTLTIVNANPTFTNFTYEDTNATTIALTGSNQKIIKGYSNVKATVSVANKATANKYATMSKYRFVVGTKQVDATYSSSSNVTMTLNAISNNMFGVYAIDSRTNSTLKQLSPSTYIEYFNPYFSSPLPLCTRTDGIGTETTLTFSGQFFNNTFGSIANDVVLTYKYKKTSDSTYINGETIINVVKTGNQFSFAGLISGDLGALGFDANYAYNIQVLVTDGLATTTNTFILNTGTPNIAIHNDGVSINKPYDESVGGDLQVTNITNNGDVILNEEGAVRAKHIDTDGIYTSNLFKIDSLLLRPISASNGTISKTATSITMTSNASDQYIIDSYHINTGTPSVPQIATVLSYGSEVLPSTEYTFSWEKSGTGTANNLLFFYDNQFRLITITSGSVPYTKTTPANCKYVCWRLGNFVSGTTVTYSNIQFVKGNTALPYVKHKNYDTEGTILFWSYAGQGGTSGYTLYESLAHFKRIYIEYYVHSTIKAYKSVEITYPNGKQINLDGIFNANVTNTTVMCSEIFNASGTTLTRSFYQRVVVSSANAVTNANTGPDNIFIRTIIGFRE